MKKLIVIIGLPGSGKDTQIDMLKSAKNIEVVRVGDLVRERAKIDSDLRKDLLKGDLVDNDKVDRMVKEKLEGLPENSTIISDGFPRRIAQAKWLESFLKEHNIEVEKYILLEISDEESIKRLLKRGRSDDVPEVIKHRIEVFHDETKPVIDFYKNKELFVEVDGIGSVEEVHQRMKRSLNW